MPRSARSDAPSLRAVRDAGLLLFVAAVLIAGLVHYSVLVFGPRTGDDAASSATSATSATSTSAQPTPPATTATAAAPTSRGATAAAPAPQLTQVGSDQADSSPSATPASATCWDGREVTGLATCGLPHGTAGLRWVFPLLGAPATSCHPAPRPAGHYLTTAGVECFARVGGQPVAITYEQVTTPRRARAAIAAAYAGGQRHDLPGARGGRCTRFDAATRPARVAGYYEGYPYVASLFAPSPAIAKRAWATLVAFRPAGAIRGRHT